MLPDKKIEQTFLVASTSRDCSLLQGDSPMMACRVADLVLVYPCTESGGRFACVQMRYQRWLRSGVRSFEGDQIIQH